MPLWRIYAHSNVFNAQQKRDLAEAVTKLYTDPPANLPAFYVNVIFIPLGDEDVFIGGAPRRDFVRITIEHIARSFGDPGESRDRWVKLFLERVNVALRPHLMDRPGLSWESHITETPRDLWRVDGIDPPPTGSEWEARWNKENRPTPWQTGAKL